MLRRVAVGVMAVALMTGLGASPASRASATSRPRPSSDRRPSGPGNTPFLATDLDLAVEGYVEEEFEYSGDAFVYDRTGTDEQTATKITTGGPI